MPRSWGEVYLDSTYPSEVLSRMLRRQSAPRVLLSSLDSAFTQTAPLTPLSSAFTKTPGGMPLLLPSDFWQRSTSHVFLLPNFQTFQRSTCKRNSCFQSLPQSLRRNGGVYTIPVRLLDSRRKSTKTPRAGVASMRDPGGQPLTSLLEI